MSTTLKLKFLTEAGSNFTLNISDANEALVSTPTPVSTLANYILSAQPFSVVLASLVSATLVTTTEQEIAVTGVVRVSDLISAYASSQSTPASK